MPRAKGEHMHVVTDDEPAVPQPVDRGRLYYDWQIADAFFEGLPHIADKPRWVRSHLPRSKMVKVGQRCAWYANDIIAYRESLRQEKAV